MNELGSTSGAPVNTNNGGMRSIRPQPGRGSNRWIWIIVAIIVVAALIAAALWLVPKLYGPSAVTGMSIGKGDMTKQEDGKFITSAELKKEDTLRLQMYYTPEKMSGAYVRIENSKGEEVFASSEYTLGATKEFSLAMSVQSFEPGDYKIIIQDQDKKEVATGTFKVVE